MLKLGRGLTCQLVHPPAPKFIEEKTDPAKGKELPRTKS